MRHGIVSFMVVLMTTLKAIAEVMRLEITC